MRKRDRKHQMLLLAAMAAAGCGLAKGGVVFAQSASRAGRDSSAKHTNHPSGLIAPPSEVGYEAPNQWYHQSNRSQATLDRSLVPMATGGLSAASTATFASASGVAVSGAGAYGSLLYDNFASDSGLNTSLWTTSGSVAAVVLANNNQGAATTIFTPTLSFDPGSGMLMTGLDGQSYRQGGIQSLDSFSGPLSVNVDFVPAKVDVGGFQVGISSADGGAGVELTAGSSPTSTFTGIWYSQPTNGPGSYWKQDGSLSSSAPVVGNDYSLGISLNKNGVATVYAAQGGALLGSATASVGTGPFFLILSEGDGVTAGDSAAIWQSVQVTPGATPIVGPVTDNWTGPNGGDWENAGNWSAIVNGTATNIVPSDAANPGYQFNVNIDGSAANLSTNATINSLTLGDAVGGGSLAVSGGLSVVNGVMLGNAAPASLFILPGGAVTDASAEIAANSGSGGSEATVSGAGAAWTTAGELDIGAKNVGSLSVSDGGLVSVGGDAVVGGSESQVPAAPGQNNPYGASGTLIGNVNGSLGPGAGTVSVSGVAPGNASELAVAGDLFVGWPGTGALDVSDGGHLTDTNAVISGTLDGVGSAAVTGANSYWATTGTLAVGSVDAMAGESTNSGGSVSWHAFGGSGTISVSGGATVSAGNIVIAAPANSFYPFNHQRGQYFPPALGGRASSGTLTVSGTNSRVDVADQLAVGNLATLISGDVNVGPTIGALSILSGARVTAGGNVSIGQASEFGSLGSGSDSVTVQGIGSELASSGGGIQVGSATNGSASLVVGDGGEVRSATGVSAYGPGTVVTVGAGSTIVSPKTVLITGYAELTGNGVVGAPVQVTNGGIISAGRNGGELSLANGLEFGGVIPAIGGTTTPFPGILLDDLGTTSGALSVTGGQLTIANPVSLQLGVGTGFQLNTPYLLMSLASGTYNSGTLSPSDFQIASSSEVQGTVSVSDGNVYFTAAANIPTGTGWVGTSGNFGGGSNWSGGSPPSSGQPAIFVGSGAASSSPITVNFTTNESNTKLVDDDANVAMNLNGNTYSLTSTGTAGAIQVGGELGLGSILNVSGGTLQSTDAVISPYPTGSGNTDQMSLTSTSWSNSGNISVGDVGSGKLLIDQNSTVQASSMNIANQAGSQGEVDNAGKIAVTGTLTVNTGGTLNQTGGSTTAVDISNSGNINLSGGALQGAFTNNSTGTIAMQQGTTITLSGDVVNNGTIDVGAGTAVVSGTTTLDGGGTLQLGGANVSPGQIIGTGKGVSVDQLTNYSTIEGAGTIGDPTDTKPFAFTNNGTLDANVNGQVLNVYGSVTGTATGQAFASNGGILYFHSTYNQTGGNTIIGSQPTPSTGSSGGTSPTGNGSGGGSGPPSNLGWEGAAAVYYPAAQQGPSSLSLTIQDGSSNVNDGNYYAITQAQLDTFAGAMQVQLGLPTRNGLGPPVSVQVVNDPLNVDQVTSLISGAGKIFDVVNSLPGELKDILSVPDVAGAKKAAGLASDIVVPGNGITDPFGVLAGEANALFSQVASNVEQAQEKLQEIVTSNGPEMIPVSSGAKPPPVAFFIAPGQILEFDFGDVPAIKPGALKNITASLCGYDLGNIDNFLAPTPATQPSKIPIVPGSWSLGYSANQNSVVQSGGGYGDVIEMNYTPGSGNGVISSGGGSYYAGGANICGGGWGGNGAVNGNVSVCGNSTVFAGIPAKGGSTVTTGKLVISGNLVINSSYSGTAAETPVLEFYLGGTTQGGSPGYDYIDVGGNASLAGDLEVGFTNGFQGAVTAADNFDIITANTTISGSLSNIQSGGRINTIDGFGSFLVSYGAGSSNPNEVVLSDFIPNPGSGLSQSTAIGPTSSANGVYVFNNIPSGAWVDPPSAKGFTYLVATPGGLFTKIDSLPTGFASTMVISVDGYNLGPFAPGDSLDLSSFPGGGATEFTITGINPLGTSTDFPLQMEFNQSNVDFLMSAVPVPEPAMLALFALGGLGLVIRKRRGRTLRS